MNIVYTSHLKMRMRQRDIRQVDVEVTLSAPDSVCHTPKKSLKHERTMVDGRTLKVWTVYPQEDPEVWVVKSAAWKGENNE